MRRDYLVGNFYCCCSGCCSGGGGSFKDPCTSIFYNETFVINERDQIGENGKTIRKGNVLSGENFVTDKPRLIELYKTSNQTGAAVFNAFTASSQKGFQAFKTFGDSIKTVAGNAGMSALALGGGKKAFPRDKFEKKMTEEIQKMFNADGPGGFYFSPTGDLTRRYID